MTTISTAEQEQKVCEGYKTRFGHQLSHSLINKNVHTACYKITTLGLKPLTVRKKVGRPKRISYIKRSMSMATKKSSHECLPIVIDSNPFHSNESVCVDEDLNCKLTVLGNNCLLSSHDDVRCNTSSAS